MSDNELDELLLQLKDACKKNRLHSSNDITLNTILKKIDVFINRRQMKLLNHQKRLDDLQRDLLLSECESSRNRVALEKKDFEVNQLHMMLNKAEQTTQNIMTKYDNEMQLLTKQLSNVQSEYERMTMIHKNNEENRSINDALNEITRLREFNKMLEIDNQRLYTENDQLKQGHHYNDLKLINSLQRSNQQPSTLFESKIKTLEKDLDFYKHRSNQQSDEIDKLRLSLNNSEQQCNSLRLELQRIQTEKDILQIHLLEENLLKSPSTVFKDFQNIDYENFIRKELETNIDQANKLINYWNSHKQILEGKIQQLTNEIDQLKKENKNNDLSVKIYQCNENVLYAKREMNTLQMEITDKNTIIYNLYKKIECLEQALTMSKQRMNAQLNEIEELRSKKPMTTSSIAPQRIKQTSICIDGLSTDDEGQIRHSIDLNQNLYTSSPILSTNIHKYFHHVDSSSSSRL
ncbi:unnamed protein product [Adineta steineri]|uniref:Uncharacterized protein n=1 Tax=Adineta steineri TaxID=433720 RepID=A0A813PPW0_9BILA|nr:unnamed protein product [Adineta steineri]